MNAKKRGSGLAAVMIFAAVLGFGIYSVLSLVEGEFRRNKKSALYHEARLGAEALLQNGMADLKARFQTTLATDALDPSNQPLAITSEFVGRYESVDPASNLVIPETRSYANWDDYGDNPMEIVGGKVKRLSDGDDLIYLDPGIPGNEGDPLAGLMLLVRSVEMLSKATTAKPVAGGVTVHARQFLQVRDAPLFAFAIFYNVPMEIAPGPRMDVYGKVHANKDAWLQGGGGESAGLYFHDSVTIAGDLSHGRRTESGLSDSDGPVQVANGEGDLVSMREDGTWDDADRLDFSGDWLVTAAEGFASIAERVWDLNLRTAEHGVTPMNLPGVSNFIEDIDPDQPGKQEFNSAYSLIQPPLRRSQLNADNIEREQQKFAYKAGLTIRVNGLGEPSYFTYERDGAGNLVYGSDGRPREIALNPVDVDLDGDPTQFISGEAAVARVEEFSDANGIVGTGMYDQRQGAELKLVEVDVGYLTGLLHGDGGNASDWGGQAPSNWWNGVVYVEFPQQSTSSSRPDGVNPAITDWGVKLVNGSVIPSPSYAADKGTTFATNQMMYVEGHYNADGDLGTGRATQPDDPANFGREGYEAPAALVADSVTFLSSSWDDSNSLSGMSSRIAADTEVSAAVLTGIVQSGDAGGTSYSGGVENFPRFLEDWGGKQFRIRGSMVALFVSEVGTAQWGTGNVYSPPNRDWGFQVPFGRGLVPPGTPMIRDFAAVDFEIINRQQYEDHLARIEGGG